MKLVERGNLERLDELISAIKYTSDNNDKQLTVNTVTVINGTIDLSIYADIIIAHKEEVINVLDECFGNGVNIYKILCGEIYYQKNECYKSLIQVVSAIPFLQTEGEYELLFAAMYVQMCVMIVTGQLNAIYPMIDSMGGWITKSGNEPLINNHRALGAWCALYDDDWFVVDNWMNNFAPDENAEIRIHNVFSLFVKGRIYLVRQKNIALISLLELVKPLIEKENRAMYRCELYILYALAVYAEGEMDDAFKNLETAIEIARAFGYDRLIADEGEAMYILLTAYVDWLEKIPGGHSEDEHEKMEYIHKLINMSKEMALLYPRYLKSHKLDYEKLTPSEMDILRLMADDRSNDEIAKFLGITLNTVKFHAKNIFKKLGVKNRRAAVRLAKEEGYL